MTVQVMYFAGLKEVLGLSQERITLPKGIGTTGALRDWLIAKLGREQLATVKNLRCAVNQDMASFSSLVVDGDEVAFFPPVTGG